MFGLLGMFKPWMIVGVLLAIVCSAALFYYNSSQHKIEALLQQNAAYAVAVDQLKAANEQNVKTIDQMQENFDKVRENYNKVQDEFQVIRMQNKELRERVAEKQLGILAVEKTKLVEKTINNASDNTLRCFELLSGSPLTDKEKNAKNEREFNAECPWLYTELVRTK